MLNSWSHVLAIITNRRPWDAPKSGQVFHFIRAREAFRSVRRPSVQGVTPSPSSLGIGLEAAAALRWIRLIKCGERESGAMMRKAEYKG